MQRTHGGSIVLRLQIAADLKLEGQSIAAPEPLSSEAWRGLSLHPTYAETSAPAAAGVEVGTRAVRNP